MTTKRVATVFDNRPRPETTGTYCRRALGELVRSGRLELVDHYLPEEVPRVPPERYDLWLYVDDGLTRSFPERHRPLAWWAIDTHLAGEEYVELAHRADLVFTAQRNGAEWFRERGIDAEWLPLAADPRIHEQIERPGRYDVSFVGHEIPGPRTELLERLRREFPNHFVGRAFFEDLARVHGESRVVFNRSVADDVNMRVFETLACGACLVTNDLAANGQSELLRDGEHLVLYREADELVDKVRWYLGHDAQRERIAAAGRAEVLARHTYRHRMERVLERAARAGTTDTVAVPGYFGHARPEVAALVPESARRVLDVGCGAGRLGESLKRRRPVEVIGIELDPQAASAARERLDEVVEGDVESPAVDFEENSFDCIVCADVLEHLRDPTEVLRRIRRWLRPDGVLVTSLPNVRHHSVVRSLLEGNWTYESAGLLDATHLRFFTRREVEKLLFRTGFEVADWRVVPGPGHGDWVARGRPREVSVGGLSFRGRDAADAEEFLTYQFLTVARPVERPRDPLVSIVIVTHGQLPHTIACLESIRRFTDEPYELVVVDNGSRDGTVEWLRAQPDLRLVENAENRGFPAAANQGIALAKGERILLLNNDTLVTTGWLRRMLDAFGTDERIGLVGPVTNEVSGPQRVPVGYDDLAMLDGWAWDWSREHRGEVVDLDRLVGFCLLVDRRVLDAVGTFDERFGIGCFEDDDLCRRAREAGFRTVVARDAFVHHVGSATFRGAGVDLGRVLSENERLYAEKWGAARDASKVRLSLCMIVRDNEGTIRSALESIRPWVDEMIVVDTGSTDRTREICRELGAEVYDFLWCDDFSAARNESFRLARGEWLFWMDSDDTIDEANGRGLRARVDGPHPPNVLGYTIRVHCPGDDSANVTAVDHVKLVRNRPDIRFEHRIHEQLLGAVRRAGGEVRFTELFVVHSGSDRSSEGRARKLERDLRILDLDLAERPDHPFVLFNLGMTHADAGNLEDAERWLRRTIAVSAPEESHVRKAFALLASVLERAERDEDAERVCREGLGRYPDDVELLFRVGTLQLRGGRPAEAESRFRTILERPRARRLASVDVGIEGFKARQNLAVTLAELGRADEAEREWRTILEEQPGYAPAWRGLGELLLDAERFDDLDRLVARIDSRASLRSDAVVLRARLLERRGEPSAAIEFLAHAGPDMADDAEILRELGRLAFAEGDWDLAERILERLVEVAPGDGAAWHNLGCAHERAGRRVGAESCYERSLSVRPRSPHTVEALNRLRGALIRGRDPLGR